MKVYVLFYDYQGYDEMVERIFSTRALAELYIYEEFKHDEDYYTSKREWLRESEYSLVEWEVDTNKKELLLIHL